MYRAGIHYLLISSHWYPLESEGKLEPGCDAGEWQSEDKDRDDWTRHLVKSSLWNAKVGQIKKDLSSLSRSVNHLTGGKRFGRRQCVAKGSRG
jgi:hypothetical protein